MVYPWGRALGDGSLEVVAEEGAHHVQAWAARPDLDQEEAHRWGDMEGGTRWRWGVVDTRVSEEVGVAAVTAAGAAGAVVHQGVVDSSSVSLPHQAAAAVFASSPPTRG